MRMKLIWQGTSGTRGLNTTGKEPLLFTGNEVLCDVFIDTEKDETEFKCDALQ